MKKQTAIEQLYLWYMDIENWIRYDEEKKHYEYQDILCKIREFEKLEKQQIIDAYEKGDKYKFEISGEQYYDKTFDNK